MTIYSYPGTAASIPKLDRRELLRALADTEQMLYLIWCLVMSGTRQTDDPTLQAYEEHQRLLIEEFRRRRIL